MSAPDPGAKPGRTADAAAERDPPGRARLRWLAEEQAALRRVAALVGEGARPAEVFRTVADELGHLIGAEATFVSRVDHAPGQGGELEGHVTVVGSYGRVSDQVPVGFRLKLLPGTVHTAALRTGRPARISGEQLAKGPYGAWVGTLGMRAAVATPIVIGGRRWGVAVAATSQPDFPAGTESRMADFMELAATAIVNAQAEQELRELADTQAALRRLATLVARGEPPEVVFAAATSEARRHFGRGTARMIRYEPDGTATLLANAGTTGPHVRVGQRWEGYPPTGLTVTVRRTGRAARVDDYRQVPGAEVRLREGILSSVAVPIYVSGRLWGMIAVGSGPAPLPPDTEQRMSEFTDLVATAVANAQGGAELARLAEEQAALRRVATLVARGAAPEEVFGAVAEEAGRLLPVDAVSMSRYEPGRMLTCLAVWGATEHIPVGSRWSLDGHELGTLVFETGRPARVDSYAGVAGPLAAPARETGLRSGVGTPIIVEGRLWGMIAADSTLEQPLPPDTEARLASFTELVATAIANAESRAALAASRARIVAAADEARRRIERNLHDGTQQQLVSLILGLRMAEDTQPGDVSELRALIARTARGLAGALEELQEISRGIHPAVLSTGSLRQALETLARRSTVPVELKLRATERLPGPVEVAAYYAVSEALANAAKHAHASAVHVELDADDATVRLVIRDDGVGGADPAQGSGLVGLRDRIEALGGTLEVTSPAGSGTTLLIEVPAERQNSPRAPEP